MERPGAWICSSCCLKTPRLQQDLGASQTLSHRSSSEVAELGRVPTSPRAELGPCFLPACGWRFNPSSTFPLGSAVGKRCGRCPPSLHSWITRGLLQRLRLVFQVFVVFVFPVGMGRKGAWVSRDTCRDAQHMAGFTASFGLLGFGFFVLVSVSVNNNV